MNIGYRLEGELDPAGLEPLGNVGPGGGRMSTIMGATRGCCSYVLGFLGPILAYVAIAGRKQNLLFVDSALAVVGIISTIGPVDVPFHPAQSTHSRPDGLEYSSSHLALWISCSS